MCFGRIWSSWSIISNELVRAGIKCNGPFHDKSKDYLKRYWRKALENPDFHVYSLFLASINSVVLFQFRQFIDQDITKNYRHNDILVNIGRVALACTLLLSFPLLIFPCRAVINRVWKINTAEYKKPRSIPRRSFFTLCSQFKLRPSSIISLHR